MAKRKKAKARNAVAWAMVLARKVGHPIRDRRERRAKDARKMRELFQ